MQRIAIDMDEVIADFNPKHLRVFNRDYNENLTLNELMGTRLRDLRPQFQNEIIAYLNDPTFFRDLCMCQQKKSKKILELTQVFSLMLPCHGHRQKQKRPCKALLLFKMVASSVTDRQSSMLPYG